MHTQLKKKNTLHNGFTLIEIIVSLAVFIVVAVIAVGAFLKILDANKQSQSLQTAMNNADFALDSMTRDLRVGYNYYCYDSNVNSYTFTSLPPRTSCNLTNQGSSSPTSAVIPTIAFYSSESPVPWGCPNPQIHIYRYNPSTGVIEKAEQACTVTTPGNVGGNAFVPLTDPSFNIQSFGLYVDIGPQTGTSKQQPKVFINMRAKAGSNLQNQSIFSVQTTASERIMNGQ